MGKEKYKAYYYDGEKKHEWLSDKDHCYSCVDERLQGYGGDISGCCCVHCNEFVEKQTTTKESLSQQRKKGEGGVSK